MSHSALHQAYLDDHRALMKGLADIRRAVNGDDLRHAVLLARTLDQAVGPHIAFEEECLLPALEREFGAEFVAHQIGDHAAGREAIAVLLRAGRRARIDPETRRFVLQRLETALDHAFGIGTVLSFLDTLREDAQDSLSQCLASRRRRRRRWLDEPVGHGQHGHAHWQ